MGILWGYTVDVLMGAMGYKGMLLGGLMVYYGELWSDCGHTLVVQSKLSHTGHYFVVEQVKKQAMQMGDLKYATGGL